MQRSRKRAFQAEGLTHLCKGPEAGTSLALMELQKGNQCGGLSELAEGWRKVRRGRDENFVFLVHSHRHISYLTLCDSGALVTVSVQQKCAAAEYSVLKITSLSLLLFQSQACPLGSKL